jgi:20S proteasome alpha/beta subunit
MENIQPYTCSGYRQEMMLLGLENRLSSENLSDEERLNLVEEIKKLEALMCMD